jgi:hypothetical protein
MSEVLQAFPEAVLKIGGVLEKFDAKLERIENKLNNTNIKPLSKKQYVQTPKTRSRSVTKLRSQDRSRSRSRSVTKLRSQSRSRSIKKTPNVKSKKLISRTKKNSNKKK